MPAVTASRNLDVLRSLAVSFVVLSHAGLLHHVPGYGQGEIVGLLGVAMFFVHTTLVLMRSLERHGSAWAPFMVRRAARIYPLAIVVVLLSAIGTRLGWNVPAPTDWRTVAANLLLVQNLTGTRSTPAVLWSLPYELQMYLVLPALFALARRGWVQVAGLLAGAMALAVGLRAPELSVLAIVPLFVPGALAYAIRERRPVLPGWTLPASILALAATFPLAYERLGHPRWTVLYWPACVALGLLLPHVREMPAGLLSRAAATVAKYSYGVYLTHSWVLWVCKGFVPMPWRAVAFLPLLVALPVVAYRLVEAPGIRLGARLTRSRALRWTSGHTTGLGYPITGVNPSYTVACAPKTAETVKQA